MIKALNYRNDRVVNRLVSEYGLNQQEAEVLFQDTLRFLALTGANGAKLSPPARIDLGWHNFILHTRDYEQFCRSSFGTFIHHEPNSEATDPQGRFSLKQTIELAQTCFGELSCNWTAERDATCGSGGC